MRRLSDYNMRGARGQRAVASGQWLVASDSEISNPQPPIPNPPSPFRLPPSAFTLIEMLVVVSIMMILVAAGASVFRPANDSRRIREAARSINVYLSSARNRAMETGRPCGVILRSFNKTAAVMTLDQCEVPPCYCGDIEGSYADVSYNGANIITATLCNSDAPVKLLRYGDLIQFNYQGPYFEIITPNGSSGFIEESSGQWELDCSTNGLTVPWTATAQPVPYRIFRSPVKHGASPLQLPAATVIDLDASGWGSSTGDTPVPFYGDINPVDGKIDSDVMILFSPNGAVQQVYYWGGIDKSRDPIFLLVGKNERMGNGYEPSPSSDNEPDWPNYQDLNNLWVVINPQTGLVTTAEIGSSSGIGADTPAKAIIAARQFARDLQGMGGK